MVWRRLRIAADTSLAALHFIFQIVLNWDDDHLHQFHIYGKDYGISYDGGIGFPDNPFRIVIDDFSFDVGDRFTYEYNFFEHWLHDIRVEAIHEDSTLKTPFCLSGQGMPGATAADDATTVGESRPFIDDLDAVRFNRNKINRQLSRLARPCVSGAGARSNLAPAPLTGVCKVYLFSRAKNKGITPL
ncbi:plasmid pRiA4b ORF-3 family protein [Photorhabdus tasmaniensis]